MVFRVRFRYPQFDPLCLSRPHYFRKYLKPRFVGIFLIQKFPKLLILMEELIPLMNLLFGSCL